MLYDTTPRSSFEADHDNWTARLPAARPRSSAGRVGAVSSAVVAPGVVARTSRLRGPSRPSASRARTVNTWVVAGRSLVTSTMCSAPGTSFTFVVPRYTSYWLTSASAAATAFHMTCTLVALPASAVTPVGAPGGRSPAPGSSVPPQRQEASSRRAPPSARRRRGDTAGGTPRTTLPPGATHGTARTMVRTNMAELTRSHQEGGGGGVLARVTYAEVRTGRTSP